MFVNQSRAAVGAPRLHDENAPAPTSIRKKSVGFKNSQTPGTTKTPKSTTHRRKALGDISNRKASRSNNNKNNNNNNNNNGNQSLKKVSFAQSMSRTPFGRSSSSRSTTNTSTLKRGQTPADKKRSDALSKKKNPWLTKLPRASIEYRSSVRLGDSATDSFDDDIDDVEWPAGRLGGDPLDESEDETVLSIEIDRDLVNLGKIKRETMRQMENERERMFIDAEKEYKRKMEELEEKDLRGSDIHISSVVDDAILDDNLSLDLCPWVDSPLAVDIDGISI